VKGKPWTVDEEKHLQVLLKENKGIRAIAKALGKTRDSVRMKLARLEVEVVQGEKTMRSTSTCASWALPRELPSIEEELKVLAAALKALETPNLDKTEVLRLRGIIQGVKVYQELLADYLDYRGLDSELLEWREKYADLAKKASDFASKSAS
jgi:hypothetical protein